MVVIIAIGIVVVIVCLLGETEERGKNRTEKEEWGENERVQRACTTFHIPKTTILSDSDTKSSYFEEDKLVIQNNRY